MLPILTAAEMRALDARAIASLGIPGPRLMESAGAGAARLIARTMGPLSGQRVVVLCGKGNNGGDGFVVARHLRAGGARVRVCLVGRRSDVKGDAAGALGRWRGRVAEITDAGGCDQVRTALAEADLVVDALLGTGLEGAARGLVAAVIAAVVAARAPVAALDLPSGLGSDRGAVAGPAVRASLTVTFAALKRSLVLHPAAAHAGQVHVVPIGIPPDEVARNVDTFLLEEVDVRALLPPRRPDAHKGTFGHLLVVGGSRGKTGAVALAGRAAMRSGAGLCTIATAISQQPVVAGLGMETMTEALPETPAGSLAHSAITHLGALAERCDAVALGPGLSLDPESLAVAREAVAAVPRPMVVDADALGALAGHLDLLVRAPAPRILTPHPGEMARLLGTTVEQVQADRLEIVRGLCRSRRVWAVLKGAGSVLGAPDGRIWVNSTGNPGMATGGTGDVLTGVIGAFLARGLAPLDALQAGVFLHGRAGDRAADRWGQEALIAGDIVETLGEAVQSLAP